MWFNAQLVDKSLEKGVVIGFDYGFVFGNAIIFDAFNKAICELVGIIAIPILSSQLFYQII